MTIQARKNGNTPIVLIIALVLLVTIAFVITFGFSQSKNRISTETVIQGLNQPTFPARITVVNETESLNTTKPFYNYSSLPLKTESVSLSMLNSTTYSHPDMAVFFFAPSHTGQDQMTGLDLTLPTSVTNINSTVPIFLDTLQFVTYTYGGYSVQQPNSTQFIFFFPDNNSQGQITGSDALTWNTYSIQKVDFDATFIAPKIDALGFDEMAIFATSNTTTYKGTEFGIRMDLKDGLIYGYIQEPNDNFGEVNFIMQEIMPNDGMIHHYTLLVLSSGVSILIDGLDYSNLNFPSNTDYSGLSFSICAVVHRFTDGWDSNGDNMIAGNFSLNLQ